jgi:4-hydroxy-2-oxoheptanedioate aldolase
VLAPYCETVEQVRGVIGGAKWRPLKGALLDRALETGEFPSEETRQYLASRNRNSIAIIGIESVPALENLEAILEVPGIDAVFVGPNDLSITLGVPDQYDHPRFESALGRVLELCTARRIPVAVHLHNMALATKWMERGVRFVLHSSDTRAMAEGFRGDFDALRKVGERLGGAKAAKTAEVTEII